MTLFSRRTFADKFLCKWGSSAGQLPEIGRSEGSWLSSTGQLPSLVVVLPSGHRPSPNSTEDPHGKAGPRAHHSEGAENGEGAADPIRGSDCGGTSAETGERSRHREGAGGNILVGTVSGSVNVKMSS